MVEIERLGNIVGEIQAENDYLQQQLIAEQEGSTTQINEFKRQYELIIRPQIEAEIRNATSKLEADKGLLEIQIHNLKSRHNDYESRNSLLQAEMMKIQQKNLDLLSQVEEWKLKYNRSSRESESQKYSIEGDLKIQMVFPMKNMFGKRLGTREARDKVKVNSRD